MCQVSVRRFRHSRWTSCVSLPSNLLSLPAAHPLYCFCVLTLLFLVHTESVQIQECLLPPIEIYVCSCSVLRVNVSVQGGLGLIPPAEDHTKLCYVDSPPMPESCCACCSLGARSFQTSFFPPLIWQEP